MCDYIKDLVSIVTPTYKRSEKLPRAIESILSQTYHNIELFVVNDNDPDDEYTEYVKNVSKKYENDSRFHLIIQDKHINGAVARNVAIRQARGEYIAFLDDDDWWELTKIEEQVKVLSGLDESWGGVSCKYKSYNSKGELIFKSKKYPDGYIYKDVLNLQSDVATSTLLLRRKCLDETGYFDENLLRNQDLQLISMFTFKYKLMEVDKFLHCVDVSDVQNRPVDELKILEYRKALYNSVYVIIDSLTSDELKNMTAIRDVELGFILIRQGKLKGLVYLFAMFSSFGAMKLTLKKFYSKFV